MNLLVFDTSTPALSVAVQADDKVKSRFIEIPRGHTQFILPTIHALLSALSLSVKDLDFIAYGAGPGSFTGLRIAVACAQGLAFGAKIPVIKLSSLAAMAETARMQAGFDDVLVTVDARMNQLYCGYYLQKEDRMALQGAEVAIDPRRSSYLNDIAPRFGVGDGWMAYADLLAEKYALAATHIEANLLPQPESLLMLAHDAVEKQQWVNPGDALPNYLLTENQVFSKDRTG